MSPASNGFHDLCLEGEGRVYDPARIVQGDHSACAKPPVDFDENVAF